MNTQARQESKAQPHMFRYYNVDARFSPPVSLNRSFMARMISCFIAALNEKPKLPRYVLIIIDKDWFESSKIVEFGVGKAVNTAIQWLLDQISRAIEIHKENLYNRKPGALATGSEPRLIWVAMLKRPIIHDAKWAAIYSLTWKFNEILEQVIACDRRSHILKPNLPGDASLFDIWGNLTASGKIDYWCEIDKQVRDFNCSKTDLKPMAKM